MTWAWIVAILPLGVLALNVANAFFWPRGRGGASRAFSVLIPCRNEAGNIEACIRAVAAQDPKPLQIVVYDDASTDDTPSILKRLVQEVPELEVVSGQSLPKGWVGKPHACSQLAKHAHAQTFLFLDADVVLEPGAFQRISSLFARYHADLVTAVPRQITKSLTERIVVPLLHLTYTSWLFLPLIWRSRDARFLAANGQILAVSRQSYDAIGGFEAVKFKVVDDMALCRNAKKSGARVVFADGHRIATCRMYQDARGVIEGFSKNIYEGLGASWLTLLVVLCLYLVAFVAPFVALAVSVWSPELLVPSGVGVVAVLATRALLCARHGHPWFVSIALHPLGILAFVGIALNSWAWSCCGQIRWRGRSYPRQRDA